MAELDAPADAQQQQVDEAESKKSNSGDAAAMSAPAASLVPVPIDVVAVEAADASPPSPVSAPPPAPEPVVIIQGVAEVIHQAVVRRAQDLDASLSRTTAALAASEAAAQAAEERAEAAEETLDRESQASAATIASLTQRAEWAEAEVARLQAALSQAEHTAAQREQEHLDAMQELETDMRTRYRCDGVRGVTVLRGVAVVVAVVCAVRDRDAISSRTLS
jgi:hypothetical protein